VRLHGVTFDYGDDEPVLHDVDLAIASGRSVGVVGRTGSGKTTFSRLVLRLVEATDGTVELGGVPIADIPMAELRRRVASIPQEVELFAGSVRDNVTLFDPAPSDDDVAAALREVGLDTLVAGGIHRELGAGGTGLSAGEAQLLALARVWLRQPDLVVLDEATARVDPETERRLAAAVDAMMRGRTTIVIAHRLSTLRRVDEIVVFDHGRIVEHDDRDTLAAAGESRFRRLLDLALETEAPADALVEQGVPR
jgi:ABC-type multidrug transport system fused ATPase/permease subunit